MPDFLVNLEYEDGTLQSVVIFSDHPVNAANFAQDVLAPSRGKRLVLSTRLLEQEKPDQNAKLVGRFLVPQKRVRHKRRFEGGY
jgi:hypothetical protein